ncbi:hypothetical protein [Ruminococcus albus]|uniref:FHA domain-containing protein n=2 Tax=Ruminococcus albus TaxID=1264 RepID=A0A011V6C5_RUMAL|nr:hypothetical protein [Ruminococcus albus]ADU23163.1 hypothetical protein Rumal_2689 [Ruminococcus albus 7 = DSM 20455]EXM41087.1 hypothetical protein RASY3_03940 [Ruminococcus albus SY3]
MKKILAILLSMVMAGMVFGSCGSEEQTETQAKTTEQVSSEDDQNREPTENDYKEQLKAIYDALKDHPFSNGNPIEEIRIELGRDTYDGGDKYESGTTEADIVNTVNGIYDSKLSDCHVSIEYNTTNNYSIDSIKIITDRGTEENYCLVYYPETDRCNNLDLTNIAREIAAVGYNVFTGNMDTMNGKMAEIVDFSNSEANSEIGNKIVEKYKADSYFDFTGRAFVYSEAIYSGAVCTYDDNWSSMEFAPYDFETYFKSDIESKGLSFDEACEYLSKDDVGVSAYKQYKTQELKDMFAIE